MKVGWCSQGASAGRLGALVLWCLVPLLAGWVAVWSSPVRRLLCSSYANGLKLSGEQLHTALMHGAYSHTHTYRHVQHFHIEQASGEDLTGAHTGLCDYRPPHYGPCTNKGFPVKKYGRPYPWFYGAPSHCHRVLENYMARA